MSSSASLPQCGAPFSYLMNLSTFEHVLSTSGHLGVDECVKQFRRIYSGPQSYSEAALRVQFRDLLDLDDAQHEEHKEGGVVQKNLVDEDVELEERPLRVRAKHNQGVPGVEARSDSIASAPVAVHTQPSPTTRHEGSDAAAAATATSLSFLTPGGEDKEDADADEQLLRLTMRASCHQHHMDAVKRAHERALQDNCARVKEERRQRWRARCTTCARWTGWASYQLLAMVACGYGLWSVMQRAEAQDVRTMAYQQVKDIIGQWRP